MNFIVQILTVSCPGIWYKKRIGELYEVRFGTHPCKNEKVFIYGQMNVIYPKDCKVIKIVTQYKTSDYYENIRQLKKLNCQFDEKIMQELWD